MIQISVSIAAADAEFAEKIAEMLEHMEYINGCDTLGQKIGDEGIHDVCLSSIYISMAYTQECSMLTCFRLSCVSTRNCLSFTRQSTMSSQRKVSI